MNIHEFDLSDLYATPVLESRARFSGRAHISGSATESGNPNRTRHSLLFCSLQPQDEGIHMNLEMVNDFASMLQWLSPDPHQSLPCHDSTLGIVKRVSNVHIPATVSHTCQLVQ